MSACLLGDVREDVTENMGCLGRDIGIAYCYALDAHRARHCSKIPDSFAGGGPPVVFAFERMTNGFVSDFSIDEGLDYSRDVATTRCNSALQRLETQLPPSPARSSLRAIVHSIEKIALVGADNVQNENVF